MQVCEKIVGYSQCSCDEIVTQQGWYWWLEVVWWGRNLLYCETDSAILYCHVTFWNGLCVIRVWRATGNNPYRSLLCLFLDVDINRHMVSPRNILYFIETGGGGDYDVTTSFLHNLSKMKKSPSHPLTFTHYLYVDSPIVISNEIPGACKERCDRAPSINIGCITTLHPNQTITNYDRNHFK